jgi:hypothetical protein
MKRRETILLVIGLVLIAVVGFSLKTLKARQRLGPPGVKAEPIAGTLRMNIDIPTNATGWVAVPTNVSDVVVGALPSDTSMGQVIYRDGLGFPITVTTVMMGTDRTSIHQPQFCLRGSGWNIDDARSELTTVHIERPQPVDLPVMKLVATLATEENGQKANYSGLYVYWFVAGDAVTAEHTQRVWSMTRTLLEKGELQRWAYISFFAPCLPGQEDATFERVKKLMNATLPQFELAWPDTKVASARP